MKFNELSKKNINEVEQEISSYWKSIDILSKTIENRKNCENFVFYDGPATANPLPVKRYTKLISLNSLLNQGIIG